MFEILTSVERQSQFISLSVYKAPPGVQIWSFKLRKYSFGAKIASHESLFSKKID